MRSVSPPVSARKGVNHLKHLFREQHILMMLLKEFRDGILICDNEGVILQVNRAFKQLIHLKEDVVGLPVSAVLTDGKFQHLLRTVLETGSTCVEEIVLKQAAAPELFFEAHMVPIQRAPEQAELSTPEALERSALESKSFVDGCVVIFHNITDIRRTEKMRRDFVANVSHELRTPLSAIEGYSETLLDGALDDPAVCRDFVQVIHRHSLRLTQLVGNLLDLSKLESTDYKPEFLPISLQNLIQQVLMLVEDKAQEKDIEIAVDISSSLPKAMADLSSLQQVLTNLLDNAIKYTPTQGHVRVQAFQTPQNKIQVEVVDTGIGIETKYHSRIFERFYRVDKARSREMGGTGLGLSIVKHIVQLHNGEIWVESEAGNGSKFIFTLDPEPSTAM